MTTLCILAFYLSLLSHTCPHILCLLVLWCFGSCSSRPLQHSHRTVVGPASERPTLILGLCSCFTIGRSGQSRRKFPPSLLPPPFLFELCPLSNTFLSSPHNNQSRTGRWITIIVLEHSAILQRTQEKERIVIKILDQVRGHRYFLMHKLGTLVDTQDTTYTMLTGEKGGWENKNDAKVKKKVLWQSQNLRISLVGVGSNGILSFAFINMFCLRCISSFDD